VAGRLLFAGEEREEVPTIREQLQARLKELKKELEAGQAELQKVEMQRTYLRETVLRIDGAVQVLEELLREGQSSERTRAAPDENSAPQLRKE
jgi:predicted nuclease with TOPRIM domain